MTQLGMGVAALNHDSKFQAAYEKGMKKTEYWQPTLEDCLDLIAKLPALAARIYRNVYHPENPIPAIDKNLDLVGNYSSMMGYGGNKNLTEYLRLYIALHGDHEGGNASAHTARKCRVGLCRFILILRRLGRVHSVRPVYLVLCCSVRPCWTSSRPCKPRSPPLATRHARKNWTRQ